MTFPDRLRDSALDPLWHALHTRLGSGRVVRHVRVGPLDARQQAALADLFGMARYPGEHTTVSVSKLDDLLLALAGMDSRDVVTEIVGPPDDRAGRRARENRERDELWEWLDGHEVVTAQPALRDWVRQVRQNGVIDGSVERTRELLESSLRVLRALPTGGMPLPAFAESVLGDPHALDEGTRVSSLTLRALASIHDVEVPADAEQRRALWERAGVAEDELSTVVLAAGLRPAGPGPVASVLGVCAENGHAAALTLGQLRSVSDLRVPHLDVWIVENPSVLTTALGRFGTDCPPMVCTSGWPNGAGIRLLRLLDGAGSRLHYHGDIDGEGIRIAAHVIAKTGAAPWHMSTADYQGALGSARSPTPGRVTEAPWDPHLARQLRHHDTAVPEERVTQHLLDTIVSASHEQASASRGARTCT